MIITRIGSFRVCFVFVAVVVFSSFVVHNSHLTKHSVSFIGLNQIPGRLSIRR